MSEAKVVDTNYELNEKPIVESTITEQPKNNSNSNSVAVQDPKIHIGKSGTVYQDSSDDELDNRLSQTIKQKPNRISSPKSVVSGSGGRRKTRRPRKPRRQTKRKRVHKKK